MFKALQLGKWVPRQQSQGLPPLRCHFSPSVLLSQASCPREIGIQYSTTQAFHRTHSRSQRHICSFFVRSQRSPLGCEIRELGREWRHLSLVGRGCRPWERVTAKSRLEYIMLPAWTAQVSMSNNQSLHSKMALSD